MNPPRYFALIPAAGAGARMGAPMPKQYLSLAGKPMLQHVLETFSAHPLIAATFVVVSPEDDYASALGVPARVALLRCGGATRHESVRNGLQQIREAVHDEDWVLVHDAARPGLNEPLLSRLIASLDTDPVGGLLALPVVDTVKRAGADGCVEHSVPRAGLWAAQTPQMFRYALLRRALEEVEAVTDEASAIEALGMRPRLIEGSPRNFKVTLPLDVALAELYLKEQA